MAVIRKSFLSFSNDRFGFMIKTRSKTKKSAYLGSTKRKTPPPRKGQERQLELCHSKASDN